MPELCNLGIEKALKSRCIFMATGPKNHKVITMSSVHPAACPANEHEA